jgi:hypothetical protein
VGVDAYGVFSEIVRAKRCGRVPAWGGVLLGNGGGEALRQALLPGFSCVVSTERFRWGLNAYGVLSGNSAGKRCGRVPAWGGAFSGTEGKTLRQECPLPNGAFLGTARGKRCGRRAPVPGDPYSCRL